MTRTTFRRRIDALEARVGAPLLLRGPGGAPLTPAGHVVVRHARVILRESSVLLASAREAGEAASGVLRLGLPVGLPPNLLATVYQLLRAAHPALGVEARFSEDPLRNLYEEADIICHFGARLTSGAWITRVVRPAREMLLASPVYLRQYGTPTTLEELAPHELLTWRRPGEAPGFLPLATGGTVAAKSQLVHADVHLLRTIAQAGGGIAFIPEGALPGVDESGGPLVPVLPGVIGRDCPLRVAIPEPLAQSVKVRRALEQAAELLASL